MRSGVFVPFVVIFPRDQDRVCGIVDWVKAVYEDEDEEEAKDGVYIYKTCRF